LHGSTSTRLSGFFSTVVGFSCLVAVQLFIGGCQRGDETHATFLLIAGDVTTHLHGVSGKRLHSTLFSGNFSAAASHRFLN